MPTKYKGIAIPTSARGLELYSRMKGVGAAGQDILRQLKADITTLQSKGQAVARRYENARTDAAEAKAIADMAKVIGRIYEAGVYKKMLEHSQFGATDTEPRYHIGQALVTAAKRMMGIDFYCEELGGWI